MGFKRKNIQIEDAESSTVSLEAIMITSEIESYEGRDAATIEITGAYLHTDLDE